MRIRGNMYSIFRIDVVLGVLVFVSVLLYSTGVFGLLWGGEVVGRPIVVLPNDLSVMSKYEGDPSLLQGYVRNDSLILNYEGY